MLNCLVYKMSENGPHLSETLLQVAFCVQPKVQNLNTLN